MAIYNGDNYAAQFVNKPSSKIEKGEIAGKKRLLKESMTLSSALALGDEIYGPKLPPSSIVTNAKIFINKSIGATNGIFSLGHLANGVDAKDVDAFVVAADAGGQAVLAEASAASAGLYKRFSKETQIIAYCSEAMDGTVLDAVIHFEVEYVND